MWFIFSLLFISILSCSHREDVLPDSNSTSLVVKSQPRWHIEKLDDAHSIQFPSSYKGGIKPTIEGPEFSLQKNDQRAYFLAPLGFFGGGAPLAMPRPDSLLYANQVLDRTVTFQRNGQTQGLFYYTSQPKSQGQMYLLKNGQLVLSMIIQYDSDLHSEILGILQTIQPR